MDIPTPGGGHASLPIAPNPNEGPSRVGTGVV
jgi:hypothetical protein